VTAPGGGACTASRVSTTIRRVSTRWSDIPFAPRRWPFFYGWVILAVTTVGTLASLPGQTMIVGVFTDHLIAALAVNRVQLSTAYMLGTIGSSLLLPFAGGVLDRIGARAATAAASLGLGVALLVLASSDHLAAALPLQPQVAGLASAAVAFLLMRFFGQGCLTLTARVTLSKWFNHRRGLAVGIAGVFISFGFNSGPVIFHTLVEDLGWRLAALTLAGVLGVGMSLFGWIFYRDNPEECGLAMDGVDDPAWHRRMEARQPTIHREYTRREALRTPAFWAFTFGLATEAFILTAVTFHIAALGAELGVSRASAYAVFWPMSFFGVSANFLGGWASDRYPMKWLLLLLGLSQAIGTVGVLNFAEPVGRALMIGGYGTSLGLFGCLLTVPWPRFFGRRHLGAINGLVTSVTVFASAIGPVVFAEAAATAGSFLPVKAVSLVLPVAAVLLALGADDPQVRAARQSVAADDAER
jgi:OFA family oxalate/formate antiporter-like MFS transporter